MTAADFKFLPFNICVIADLSPGKNLNEKNNYNTLEEKSLIQLTSDNFDDVMKHLDVQLELDLPDLLSARDERLHLKLVFRRLSDFDPSSICRQVVPLRRLLAARNRLMNLNELQEARGFLKIDTLLNCLESCDQVDPEPISSLDAETSNGKNFIPLLMKSLTQEHILPHSPARIKRRLLRSIEKVVNTQLLGILHAKGFQQLESTWRGLKALVEAANDKPNVLIQAINASKKELLEDWEDAPQFANTGLFNLLYSGGLDTLNASPTSMIVADFGFERHPLDIKVLKYLAMTSAVCQAPLLTAASPGMFGIMHFNELHQIHHLNRIFDRSNPNNDRWQTFREHSDARFVYICIPRILLRRPHTEELAFHVLHENLDYSNTRSRHGYLWGNPAYLIAAWISRNVDDIGWWSHPAKAVPVVLAKIPVHTYRDPDGESRQCGPTEVALNDPVSIDELSDYVQDRELAKLGFLPILQGIRSDEARIKVLTSAYSPLRSIVDEETASGNLLGLMSYLLPACRIIHKIKCEVRDRPGIPFIQTLTGIEGQINQFLKSKNEQSGIESPFRGIRVLPVPSENLAPGIKTVIDLELSDQTIDPGQLLKIAVDLPWYDYERL